MRAQPVQFAQVVAVYGEVLLSRAKLTRKSESTFLARALRDFEAKSPPLRFPAPMDWLEYFNGRIARGELLPGTARTYRKVAWRAYDQARRLRFPLLVNPLDNVPSFQEPTKRPRSLADAARTFPSLLSAMPDYQAKAFLSTLRRHGLRGSEGLGIEPRALNWSRGLLGIAQQRAPGSAQPGPLKTDTSVATVPIHPETAALLREAARERMAHPPRVMACAVRAFVFDYFAPDLDRLMAICRDVAPADFPRREIGVRGGDAWHVFRHTFGTEAVARDVPLHKLKVLLRHKSIQTTADYVSSIRGNVLPEESLHELWHAEAAHEAATARDDLAAARDAARLRSVSLPEREE